MYVSPGNDPLVSFISQNGPKYSRDEVLHKTFWLKNDSNLLAFSKKFIPACFIVKLFQ